MAGVKSTTSPISGKLVFQVALALVPIAFSIYFIKHNGHELEKSLGMLQQALPLWVVAGLTVTVFYLVVHALMYVAGFRTLHARISFASALILSLKRNFISVFLPAGGVTSLAFFTEPIEKQGVSKTRIHLASTIYGICGFVSLILIALPAIVLLLASHHLMSNVLYAFVILLMLVLVVVYLLWSFLKGGRVFRLASRHYPKVIVFYEELKDQQYSLKGLVWTIIFSLLIEVCGIAHLYIALKALGLEASAEVALFGYVVATLMYAISPFLRGLGAVEISLTVILVNYGVPQVSAISASLLYRLFEFWIPLLVSAGSFVYRKENLFLRMFPSLLVLLLGMVNIFSVLTPAVAGRVDFVRDFLPAGAIHISNWIVILAGVFLVILSGYLVRGLRNAWVLTLVISCVSVIGHLTKAVDYEEAIFGLAVVGILLYTRRHYIVKTDRRLWQTTRYYLLAGIIFLLVYSTVGFYLIDRRHFGSDFSLFDSLKYGLSAIFFFDSRVLVPQTHFARWFLESVNWISGAYGLFLVYTAFKPPVYRTGERQVALEHARDIVARHGRSSLDYFKLYPDKQLHIDTDREFLTAFRLAGDYAVVLELPVCPYPERLAEAVTDFDDYCFNNGLKTIYYRVDEEQLPLLARLGKKSLFIGQEGLIDLHAFSLEGGDMKPIRNAIHKAENGGFQCKVTEPPVKEGTIQKLKAVSDEWLAATQRNETWFSQGIFNPADLKGQTLFIVEDAEEKVVAFTNIIPDYAANEATYDLIRKTADAPGGVLDVLMVAMIAHFREQGKRYLNIGMAPLSGLEKGKTLPEATLKFAYENLRQLGHFKGLRFFKEKYAEVWSNKYLVYNNDLDLIRAPFLISRVSKAKHW